MTSVDPAPRSDAEGVTFIAEAVLHLPKGSDFRVVNRPLSELAGAKADPAKSSLAAFRRRDLTAAIGTEFPAASGIQLSKLTDQQVQDLALLVAERGVVFFRDQDIDEAGQLALGRKLGPIHVHPLGWSDPDKDEIQVFSADASSAAVAGEGWHSDVSFETEPAAYSMLKITKAPEVGGDTLWISGYAAYDRLTPTYKRFLEGLQAYHTNAHRHYTGLRPDLTADQLRYYRRGPHTSLHPVVRTHPLTRWKSLFVNEGFTTQIKGLTKGESDSVLQFLFNHVKSDEFKVRFKWEDNSVAIWDNRATQHEAVWDYYPSVRRGVRVVATGERPFFDPSSGTQAEALRGKGYAESPAWRRSVL
ncbi:tfdA family taurine dioxygenase [Hyaloraphidium curvatum]|nr:tfdA family taurine dioxygenase [Hyaloraphidium curvatum]